MASPEFEALVRLIEASPIFARAPVETLRANIEAGAGLAPLPGDVVFSPVDANGVPAEWSTPPGAADGALLYFHGGGYFMGSLNTHRRFVAVLARAAGVRALSVDYRLAPEHPFPAAVDDALAAYGWLLGEGFAAERIVVAGDSAGGGLTLALLVAARDTGLPRPAAAVAISPLADFTFSGDSHRTRSAVDVMITPESALTMRGYYLADGDPSHPLASPLWADLSGLPPLLVTAGDREVLLDDAVRVVERAAAAGVDATLDVAPEMFHVYQVFTGSLPEADEGMATITAFVAKHLDL